MTTQTETTQKAAAPRLETPVMLPNRRKHMSTGSVTVKKMDETRPRRALWLVPQNIPTQPVSPSSPSRPKVPRSGPPRILVRKSQNQPAVTPKTPIRQPSSPQKNGVSKLKLHQEHLPVLPTPEIRVSDSSPKCSSRSPRSPRSPPRKLSRQDTLRQRMKEQQQQISLKLSMLHNELEGLRDHHLLQSTRSDPPEYTQFSKRIVPMLSLKPVTGLVFEETVEGAKEIDYYQMAKEIAMMLEKKEDSFPAAIPVY